MGRTVFFEMSTNDRYYTITCVACGKEWDEQETCTTCLDCNNALEVGMDLELIGTRLNRFLLEHAPLSTAKYLDFYPIADRSKVISLREGDTPLYAVKKIGAKLGLKHLYVKNEGANPTGVFKDRGSLVEITKALEMGANGVCVASTGNMAASVAAYSSQAGLPCYILVPEGTPIGKLSQTLSYGGQLIQVRGTYADCVVLAEEMAKRNNYYLGGDYAFRAEGAKSTAYEIIEQLHWKVPDVVIVPIGCGTNISGVWKGFVEFHELGLIDRLPSMIGVQPTGSDTVCTAFKTGAKRFTKVEKPQTIASAVGIGVPQDDIKALRALRDSKGDTAIVNDTQILAAQKLLSKEESIFTEPSGAIPIAVLEGLLERQVISSDDTIVCVATGTGLKDPKAAIASFSDPPSVDPNIEEIERLLTSGSISIEASDSSKETVVFETMPTEQQLHTVLKDEFKYDAAELIVKGVALEVENFIKRGKEIRTGDLFSILQEAIEDTTIPHDPMQIVDFESVGGISRTPHGSISIEFAGTPLTAEADGVGPVDALIKALQIAVSQQTAFWPMLEDFSVDVSSSRENALVKVKMEMSDADGNKVSAKASSPDIIVASLHAFAKGFNLLYPKK